MDKFLETIPAKRIFEYETSNVALAMALRADTIVTRWTLFVTLDTPLAAC